MGLFDKLKNIVKNKNNNVQNKETEESYDKGLKKTREEFVSKLSLLGIKYTRVSEEYFEELEDLLISADIGVNTVFKFMDKLRNRVKSEKIEDTKELMEVIVDELFIIYVNNESLNTSLKINNEGPTVVLIVGVNCV